jgi:hypothetical protein
MKNWTTQEKLDFLKAISNEGIATGLAKSGLQIDYKALLDALGMTGVIVELDKPEQMNIGIETEDGTSLTLSIRGKIEDLKGSLDSEPVRKIVKKLLEIIEQLEQERTVITMTPVPLQPWAFGANSLPPSNAPIQYPNSPTWGSNTGKVFCQSNANLATSDATGYVDRTRSWAEVEGDD